MVFFDREFTFDRVVRLIFVLGLIWGGIQVLSYLSDVLVPFAAALLLAYLMHPLVDRVQRSVKNRGLAVFLTLAATLALITALSWVFVPRIASEFSRMTDLVADFASDPEVARRAADQIHPKIVEAAKDLLASEELEKYLEEQDLGAAATQLAKRLLPGLWKFVAGTASVLLGVLGAAIILLYLFFLLLDYSKISEGWKCLLPEKYQGPVGDFLHDFEDGMSRYFRGQAIIAGTVGVLFAVGFSIIGLPMGILFGLFVGLLNMVPYLQLVAFIPALFLCLIQTLDAGTGFWIVLGQTALVFAVVQSIQEAVLIPRIMGRIMGMAPALLLLSLSVWGKLLGLLGLLIALPATVLIFAYYRRFLLGVSTDEALGECAEEG
jgi:predicted PurR-regulated permease PerM